MKPGYLVLTGLEFRSAERQRMKVLFCTNVWGKFDTGCGQSTVRAGVQVGSLARCRFCRVGLRVISLDEAFDLGAVRLADYSVDPSSDRLRNDPETALVDLDYLLWGRFKSRRSALEPRRVDSKAAAIKQYQDFTRSQDQRRGLQIVSS
ncbi:MAG: hypothetical protein WEB59_06215 [Thermoanaerobaculia bacterium]